jgi:hypothetical protein
MQVWLKCGVSSSLGKLSIKHKAKSADEALRMFIEALAAHPTATVLIDDQQQTMIKI